MMIDVDQFKTFNDSYGHLAGNKCLKEVARALNLIIKRPSDFVARYGGEEFLIVLPNTDDAVFLLAESCRKNIENLHIPYQHSSVANHITISVDVSSTVPNGNSDLNELVMAADKALFEAKASGRNKVSKSQFASALQMSRH